jgi:hypothetical protein
MFLNGRHTVSWGVNPVTAPSGTVAKALFEPDQRWHCKDVNGNIARPAGIEVRFFQFVSDTDTTGEGGVIEVQVFRAKGKSRRTPRLGEHGCQERFGIS